MTLLKLFSSILLITCFASCIRTNPANLWFYTHSIDNNTVKDTLLTPTSFLNLQKDGTYTRDFGSFEYGHWRIKGQELLLTSTGNATTHLPVKYAGAKELQLITGKDIIANFDAQPTPSAGGSKRSVFTC